MNGNLDNCTDCKRQKITATKLPVDKQNTFFLEMFDMLEDTKSFKQQTVNRNWEYSELLALIFDKYELSNSLTYIY